MPNTLFIVPPDDQATYAMPVLCPCPCLCLCLCYAYAYAYAMTCCLATRRHGPAQAHASHGIMSYGEARTITRRAVLCAQATRSPQWLRATCKALQHVTAEASISYHTRRDRRGE